MELRQQLAGADPLAPICITGRLVPSFPWRRILGENTQHKLSSSSRYAQHSCQQADMEPTPAAPPPLLTPYKIGRLQPGAQDGAGADDEVPGVQQRAAAGAHVALLLPARDAGRPPHLRGLRRVGVRARVPGRAGALDRRAGAGMETHRRRRARPGRRLLRPDLAHRPRFPIR